ncbi:MAG: phenylalanine-4-hydroxylase [Blastocatellia bacterium]|jgi:phenylalanine-4-hydroxylase|nr:phenylalanine-4-hydroxylase [Blastocatellia bacterium]
MLVQSEPGAFDPELLINPPSSRQSVEGRPLVQLDPDHPGFRDKAYRARRNTIAQIALDYRSGQPIPEAPYSKEEDELWGIIRNALEPVHAKHACAEFLQSLEMIELPRHRIPQLSEVTEKVQAKSGFRLEPVAGLVEAQVFLQSLSNGVFLSTQYIRHHSAPLYTPEPDVVHEVIGHAVTLASPRLAELNRLFGEVVMRASSADDIEKIGRIYWYTIEFGVVREDGQPKAFGAGLVSSAGELAAIEKAEIRPFDLEAASRQNFDPTSFQPVLFCADSFEAMYSELREYLLNWS